MKILMVHNFYQSSSPSGEDVVYQAERGLLRSHGNEVISYERTNDDILNFSWYEKLSLSLSLLWSKKTYDLFIKLSRQQKPDLVHFHNIFYLISPSAYSACRDLGIPVVQTIHNFRFFCINGLLLRNGRVCEDCLGKLPWRGSWRKCYRASILYSLGLTAPIAYHRFFGTLGKYIDAFIVLTEFTKKKCIEGGLPPQKVHVKPNFLNNPPRPCFKDEGYIIFLGRLSNEKGLNVLLDAMKLLRRRNNGRILKVIGEGPAGPELRQRVLKECIDGIEFLGKRSFWDCIQLFSRSVFMVLPSIWYEGFPMVILEAYASGKPVIASRLGSMAELVVDQATGLLFNPEDPEDLASKIEWLIENKTARLEMGKNARKTFEEKYTAENNYDLLQDIYKRALSASGYEKSS